jgi:aspartate/tyrosine/aromatic aminotransferase
LLYSILWLTEGNNISANHQAIFRNVGIEPVDYPYYDPKTIGLDFDGFIGALKSAPTRSIFLLHACAHNPTGVDPTQEQWKAIADVMLERKHYAFFDCAYQGFASGDLDKDAFAVRYFGDRGVAMLVCQVGTGHSLDIGVRLTSFYGRVSPKMRACMVNVLEPFTWFQMIRKRRIA